MILVGIHAGLRLLSEGLTLRWADVDLRRGLVTVQAAYAKSGKTRTVPLNTPLRAALATLRKPAPEDAEFVFARRDGSPYRSIRTTFHTACDRRRAQGRHAARPSAHLASRLAMADVDPRTIQELGGWSSLEMVERYTHLSPTHKAEALERIASKFPTLFTTPAPARIMKLRKRAKSKDAPVAQVDRATVS